MSSTEAHVSFAREAARKSIHLTSAVFPALLAVGVARRKIVIALALLLAIAVGVEIARRTSVAAADRFQKSFAPLLRPRETRELTGATWLLGAMLIAVAVLPRDAAIVATWAVAVGDASAALIGIRFGRHRVGGSRKSLEGSAACAVTTMCGATVLAGMPLVESFALGVVAALAERMSWPADDNVRIVALVGATAWLWTIALY